MVEIGALLTHINNYSRTRKVCEDYIEYLQGKRDAGVPDCQTDDRADSGNRSEDKRRML